MNFHLNAISQRFQNLRSIRLHLSAAACSAAMLIGQTAGAQTYTTIRTFVLSQAAVLGSGGQNDISLAFDPTGEFLYGETSDGGVAGVNPNGNGTLFMLKPPVGGGTQWTYTDLHDFKTDGRTPIGGLTVDHATGSVYGVTQHGGPIVANDGQGNGTVFRLQTTGTPGVTTIATFGGYSGSDPVSPPLLTPSGNLIGATFAGSYNYNANAVTAGVTSGSTSGYGLIYNLAPPISGITWTNTALIRVADAPLMNPAGPLLQTASGDIYGVTKNGGTYNAGTAFRMRKIGATWTAIPIYVFLPNGPGAVSKGDDGINPQGGLIADNAGNLYGTTTAGGPRTSGGAITAGGPQNIGTVFKLTPPTASAGWTETIIYDFYEPDKNFGGFSRGNLVMINGSLYGVAPGGISSAGVIFRVTPPAAGQTAWSHKVVHTFSNEGLGVNPTIITDGNGSIYGSTVEGEGADSKTTTCHCGTVFKFTPAATP